MDKTMKLSIVTTLYKSSQYIDEFYTRISKEAQKITDDYEIIFVDDGSPDDSLQKAVSLYEKDNEINPNNYKSYCNKFDDSVKFNFIEILPESNFSYVGIRK